MPSTEVTRIMKQANVRKSGRLLLSSRACVANLQNSRCQSTSAPNEELTKELIGVFNRTLDAAAKRENVSGWKLSQSRGLVEEAQLRKAVMGKPRGDWKRTDGHFAQSRASSIPSPFLENVPLYLPNQPVSDVRAGYLAEAHRNNGGYYGVVVGFEQRRRELNVVLLGADGLLHVLRTTDLTFAYARFIDQDLVSQTGLEDTPENEMQAAARIRIVKRVREIESAIEHASGTVLKRSASLYAKFRSTNKEKWGSMSIEDALTHVFGPRISIRVHHVLALRDHLLMNPIHFLIDTVDTLNSKSYYLRPYADVQNFEQVQEWIRNDNPNIRSFVEKARVIIQRSRSLRAQRAPLEKTPVDVEGYLAFTDTDKQIIKFFQNSNRRQRFIQSDPWAPIIPTIIKRIGLYEGSVDQPMVFHMLQELGVYTPWDAIIAHGSDGTEMNLRGVSLGEPGTSRNEKAAEIRAQELLQLSEPARAGGNFQLYDGLDSIRHDFGNLPVYAVDDYDAQEIDDGVSIEEVPGDPNKHWVHIHIADPSSIIHPLDDIVRPIEQAGISTYFVNRSWPMIPSSISQQRFSLGQLAKGLQPQPVLTFSALVDGDGNIVNHRVTPGWVRNVQALLYDDVDNALGAELIRRHYPLLTQPPEMLRTAIDSKRIPDLSKLAKVATLLKRRRFRHPIIAFPSTSIDIELISDKTLPIIPPLKDLTHPHLFRGYPDVQYSVSTWTPGMISRNLVGEFMLAAGIVAARFARDHNIPLIFRVSDRHTGTEEDDAELFALRDPRDLTVPIVEVFKRHVIFGTAMYTANPGPHTTIGIVGNDSYSRVTSPLRRFTDLVNHWQIKAALRKTLSPQSLSPSPIPGGVWRMKSLSKDTLMRIGREHDVLERATKRSSEAETATWAMRALARAFVDPSMSHAREVLSDLEAIVMSEPTWDIDRRELYADAYIPKLGLIGSVYPYPFRPQGDIGKAVRVQFMPEDSIKLLAIPKIRLKLKNGNF
ncbi:uncharacterized protein EI90DRAFT_2990376 [Cantharellus anzutake]|uniref:uncharacterized protein n=1 Tax=Cantharellus anzutake TaxID=1750568 RepID=UPI001908740D|nr:uncharacterized protein EI90DRAFT_2990376 [Cantharellus anzutake]KAF8339762.1 hypothetical protein EI90DRAFT_2990376 [Cantharellus anzutake]